jgi:hypothetical protein
MAVSRGFITAFVLRCIGVMGIVTPKETLMQTPLPNPPNKEGPFLPWLKTQELPGPTSVKMQGKRLQIISLGSPT